MNCFIEGGEMELRFVCEPVPSLQPFRPINRIPLTLLTDPSGLGVFSSGHFTDFAGRNRATKEHEVSATLDLNDALCRIRLEGAIESVARRKLKTLLVQALHSGPRVRLCDRWRNSSGCDRDPVALAAEREASRSGAGIAFDAAPSGEIAAGMREAGLNPL